MVYLIVSLVAGLIFVIWGKVKFGKTLYLEGTKARIAGLIFLATAGLMLVVTAVGILYESTGNVTDPQAFEQSINALGSGLLMNGLLIGLAYINFHSAFQETKERGGCLTYGLAYFILVAALLVYYSLFGLPAAPSWLRNVLIGLSVLQILFILGVWFWKKWGVFGYAILAVVSPIIAFINTNSVFPVLVSLIQALSLVLVLFMLVKPKWQFFE